MPYDCDIRTALPVLQPQFVNDECAIVEMLPAEHFLMKAMANLGIMHDTKSYLTAPDSAKRA